MTGISIGISDKSCHHISGSAGKVSDCLSAGVFYPAFYLNSCFLIKVIFLTLKFQPAFLFGTVFVYVIGFPFLSDKSCYCCISFSIITDLLRGILYRIHILLSTCEKQQFASNLRLLVTVNIMNNDETVTLFAVPHMIGL